MFQWRLRFLWRMTLTRFDRWPGRSAGSARSSRFWGVVCWLFCQTWAIIGRSDFLDTSSFLWVSEHFLRLFLKCIHVAPITHKVAWESIGVYHFAIVDEFNDWRENGILVREAIVNSFKSTSLIEDDLENCIIIITWLDLYLSKALTQRLHYRQKGVDKLALDG